MKLILFFSFLGLLQVSSFAGTKPSFNPDKKKVVPEQKDAKGFWGFVSWAKGEKDKEILELKKEVSKLKNQLSLLSKDKSACNAKFDGREKDLNICRFVSATKEDHKRSLKNALSKNKETLSQFQAKLNFSKKEQNSLNIALEDENYALKQEMSFNEDIFDFQKEHIEELIARTNPRELKSIHTNKQAFAALKKDGTVITWGIPSKGGNSSHVQDKLKDVVSIDSTLGAFAALKKDGQVVTWGDDLTGGDSRQVSSNLNNIKDIFSTDAAFAALKNDGSVITWGHPDSGGKSDHLKTILKSVKTILSNKNSFAAVKNDDSIVTWGDPEKDE